jgi:putative ABC transport system permease protein
MLALAQGFRATLVASGSAANAIVRRAGADSEMVSAIALEELRTIEDAAGVARDARGPLASGEVVVIAAFPLARTGTDANVQVRGVRHGPSPSAPSAQAGGSSNQAWRLVVGSNMSPGASLWRHVRFGGGTWRVVRSSTSRSAFDSRSPRQFSRDLA